MLGCFINRCLVLLLGYLYPAFLCYKSAEKKRVDVVELRFWCQYWILVAFLTVFESVGDVLISWLPMYGEAKVGLFVYLWCPKTKGTSFVYDTILQPYLSKHEAAIDRKVQELKGRAWDLVASYLQNCTAVGQAKLFEMLHLVASQALSNPLNQKAQPQKQKSGKTDLSEPNQSEKENSCSQTEDQQAEETSKPDSTPAIEKLQQARLKLRRSKPIN